MAISSSESRVIIRYCAAKSASQGGANLLGDALDERALVDQWMEVEVNNYNPLIYKMVLQLLVLLQSGQVGDMELVGECKGILEKVLDVYKERLSKSKYLGGERFTIADATHLPNTRFLMEDLIGRRPSVYNWWMEIPAVHRGKK